MRDQGKRFIMLKWLVSSLFICSFAISNGAAEQEDGAQKAEIRALQGTWQMISAHRNELPMGNVDIKNTQMVIKGDIFSLQMPLVPWPGKQGPKTTVEEAKFQLDLSRNPKEMKC